MKRKRPLLLASLLLTPTLLVGCVSGVEPYGDHDIDINYIYNKTYQSVMSEKEMLQYKANLESIQAEVIKQVEKQLAQSGVTVVKAYESFGEGLYIFTLKKDDLIFSAKYDNGKVFNDYYTSMLSQELNQFIKEDLDLTNLNSTFKSKVGFQLRPIYDDGTQLTSTEDIQKQDLEGYLYFDFDPTLSNNYQEQFLRSLWQLKKEYRISELSIFVTSFTDSEYRSDIMSNRIRLDDSLIMSSNGTPSYYLDLNHAGATLYGAIEEETDKTNFAVEELDSIKRGRVNYLVEEGTADETKK